MTWVKVCGVRTLEDVAVAAEAGADAVGLVLADSPRQIDPSTAHDLARSTTLATYLVTVDMPPDRLVEVAAAVGVSGVQPHGRHAAAAAAAARAEGLAVLRPVPMTGPADLSGIPLDEIPLLDASVPGLHGGTGRSFQPSWAVGIERRWVLAGGLGPGRVADAIRRLRPWGVDASSRLESAPGRKDPERIRRFVEEAKSA